MHRIRVPYYPQPDYSKPAWHLPSEGKKKILTRLAFLYGEEKAKDCLPELERILQLHYAHKPEELIEWEQNYDPNNRFSQKDIILTTYGDMIISENQSPLDTLDQFLHSTAGLSQIINTIHLLPFFPYSSDRGFSVTDFTAVNPRLGSWENIEEIGKDFKLMFDAVFNHISSQSNLFKEILACNPRYINFVTAYQSPDKLTPEQRSLIVRPRTSDILTKYDTLREPIWVWTTFSPDQIDLDYHNPQVLLYVLDTLLIYVRHGANIIRLDAVTYLWEEPGTCCANLKQTHETVKLFRDVLDLAAPDVAVITETNIPHEQNISYFGQGNDEAQLVYNFALPPLVLYTFYREDSTILSQWAKELPYPSATTNFFNILDTHDGIGLMGAKNILSSEDLDFIIRKAKEHGAFISYKTGDNGEKEAYEINSTWFSALNFDNGKEDLDLQVKRFVASRSIALALRGIPGIYLHGLLGTRNDVEGALKTRTKRDINRQAIQEEELFAAVKDRYSQIAIITRQLGRLLEIRVRQKAFHPNGEQKILMLSPEVFAVWRTSPDRLEHILAVTNICAQTVQLEISLSELEDRITHWYNLVGKRGGIVKRDKLMLTLHPYEVSWLIPFAELEKMIDE